MDHGFRFEPIETDPERLVLRPRLTRLLADRFDHRVTTVVGAAGSGKSTALALAIDNNRLDPIGHDIWLGLMPDDNDEAHLLAGIAEALGIEAQADDPDITGRIYDAVWSMAPLEVVIHLDDVHLITAEDGVAAIETLVIDLPRNGHLVLSSRSPITVPLARVRSHHQLLEITDKDLALHHEEVDQLRTRRGHAGDGVDIPRHIATADLQLVVGSDAGIEFLWQEILSGLDPDRLSWLRRAALLEELDDQTVQELTDGRFDASALVAELPLVERHGQSTLRMHQLLRDALTAGLDDSEQRKGLELAAGLELRRHRHAAAVRLYHDAGHDIAARDAAREYVMVPTLRQSMADVATIRQIIADIAPGSALELALEASQRFGGLEEHVTKRFQAMAEAARDEDDDLLETLALHRILQAAFIGLADVADDHVHRVHELSATSPFAAGVEAHMNSQLAERSGDIAGALAALDDYHLFGQTSEIVLRAERLCDLGRPEQVGVGLSPDDLGTLAAGSEIFVAYAMWLRGEAAPELAESVVAEMLPAVLRRGVTHPSVSILGVGTTIALAAGDLDTARRRADQARELCELGVGTTISQFAHVAAASVAAVARNDAAAAEILDPASTLAPFDGHAQRAHLLALPLIYLTRPESRAALDNSSFGPALTTAVGAGRALVELREHGSTTLASRLPWSRPNVLRAHVLPPHLTELACAAADSGNDAAREMLTQLPNLAPNLARVENASGARASQYALRMLGQIPRQPPAQLTALLLGPMMLKRNGVPIRNEAWDRRAQVRELCAILLERRSIERAEVLGLLWPDHPDEGRAQASLRTALSTLHSILEPDRPDGTEPFFLRSQGNVLTIDPALTTDVDRFDELIAAAIADDRAGLPASALAIFEQALDLYRGDYLEGLDTSWLVMSRLRLQSLASSGMCRMAELTSARGEPEQAARWAMKAGAINPFDQRAGRLFIAALDAAGHRSGARHAAAELKASLADNSLALERQTKRLFDRLER